MEIDTGKLEEVKKELIEIKTSINNSFNAIDKEIKTLSSYWEGDAASEYISKFNKITLGFKDYISGLGKIIEMLETSISEKDDASSNIINYVSGLFNK